MLFGLGKDRNKNKKAQKAKNNSSSAKKTGAAAGFRRMARGKGRSVGITGNVNKLFHGVAVKPRDENCCEAVEALGGQRFLSEEAPLLPLADCSNPQGCRCVYEHFDERRDNLRRESDVGLPMRTHLEEKRAGLGRRITDG